MKVTSISLISLVCAGVAAAGTAAAQVPATMNYQGRVVGSDDRPSPGPVDIAISIWDAAAGGSRIYSEEHRHVPLSGGVFDVRLGTGTDAQGTLDAATFGAADRWLEVAVDADTMHPRQPFSSVAYAFRAQHAAVADSVVGFDPATVVPRSGGSFTGPVYVNGPNGKGNITLGALGSNPNLGALGVLDADGAARATMFVDGTGKGQVTAFTADGKVASSLTSISSGGLVTVFNTSGEPKALLSTTPSAGFLNLVGANGKNNVLMGPSDENANHGRISVLDAGGEDRLNAQVDANGNGRLTVRGAGITDLWGGQLQVNDANNRIKLFLTVDPNNQGNLDVARADGRLAAFLRVRADGEGIMGVTGPRGEAGNMNVFLGSVDGDPNRGTVSVHDQNSVAKAGMYVNSSGRGQIFADVKNFVVDHPTRPGFQIAYASVEGPEVAMYHRGRVRLSEGRAVIALPEHFVALAVPETVTVQLTPISADSEGVAVFGLSAEKVEIGELHRGRGSYDVHFLVHAVRRGYEGYAPVVARADVSPSAAPSAGLSLSRRATIGDPRP